MWKGRSDHAFLLSDDIKVVKIEFLCKKLMDLLKGAFDPTKNKEFRSKHLLMPVSEESIETMKNEAMT